VQFRLVDDAGDTDFAGTASSGIYVVAAQLRPNRATPGTYFKTIATVGPTTPLFDLSFSDASIVLNGHAVREMLFEGQDRKRSGAEFQSDGSLSDQGEQRAPSEHQTERMR